MNEVKSIREQEKTLIANKKLIENLKNENLDLKENIISLKERIQKKELFSPDLESKRLNKKLLFGGIGVASILLLFTTIQFISNQKLNKKLFSLNEQVEEYQHQEADEEINKVTESLTEELSIPENKSEDKLSNSQSSQNVEGAVSFAIINSISFPEKDVKVGTQRKIKRLYKIKPEEGAIKIAKKFNMTLDDFKNLNPKIKNINNVKSGEFIQVYDIVGYKNYKVKPRESLGLIARKHKMWSYEVKKINNITNPNYIRSGQQLIVFKSKYY